MLTARERDVCRLILEEKLSKEVAYSLGLSVRTVETHRNRIYKKLKIHNAVGLARIVWKEGKEIDEL